jgi:hypothetical protein
MCDNLQFESHPTETHTAQQIVQSEGIADDSLLLRIVARG